MAEKLTKLEAFLRDSPLFAAPVMVGAGAYLIGSLWFGLDRSHIAASIVAVIGAALLLICTAAVRAALASPGGPG